jgi:hypothetical protein
MTLGYFKAVSQNYPWRWGFNDVDPDSPNTVANVYSSEVHVF